MKEEHLNEDSPLKMRLVIPSLVCLCVLTATARPQWIQPPLTKGQPTRDLLLLVDLSASMDQKDFTNKAGKQVTRLDALKEVLSDFLERRKGDRVGLVVFGDAAYLQAPFSTDIDLSRELLEECEVGMAGPKTVFGDAIGLGVSLFDESQAPAKTIISLTDGNDTKSGVPPVEAARVSTGTAAEGGARMKAALLSSVVLSLWLISSFGVAFAQAKPESKVKTVEIEVAEPEAWLGEKLSFYVKV